MHRTVAMAVVVVLVAAACGDDSSAAPTTTVSSAPTTTVSSAPTTTVSSAPTTTVSSAPTVLTTTTVASGVVIPSTQPTGRRRGVPGRGPSGLAADPSVTDDLMTDIQVMAAYHDITVDEALARRRLTKDAGILQDRLRTEMADTFAGLWIDQHPEFRVTVALTGEQSVSDPILTDPLPAGLVDFVAADYSLVELERATLPLTKGTATRPFDLGVDVRRNRVVLRALAGDELDTFLVAREVAQLHPAIDIVIVEALSRPTTAIYGGLSLVPDCTGPAFPRSC